MAIMNENVCAWNTEKKKTRQLASVQYYQSFQESNFFSTFYAVSNELVMDDAFYLGKIHKRKYLTILVNLI